MSSSSYQQLPSDESSNPPITKAPSVRKVLVLAVAFVFVILVSYKAGYPGGATTSISEKVLPQDNGKLGDQLQQEPSSNNTTMSGKYSVG